MFSENVVDCLNLHHINRLVHCVCMPCHIVNTVTNFRHIYVVINRLSKAKSFVITRFYVFMLLVERHITAVAKAHVQSRYTRVLLHLKQDIAHCTWL